MPIAAFLAFLFLVSTAAAADKPTMPDAMWSSDSSHWQRVPNVADAPAGGVTLGEQGLLPPGDGQAHQAYLLADANVDDMVLRFRQVAGVKNPPGKPAAGRRCFPPTPRSS